VSYLPDWLEPLSRAFFLFWSANLLRDAMVDAPVGDVAARLGAIAGLGVVAAIIGFSLIERMLVHLKREGTLGLS
jgi:ABC-2 type transport system permease protein